MCSKVVLTKVIMVATATVKMRITNHIQQQSHHTSNSFMIYWTHTTAPQPLPGSLVFINKKLTGCFLFHAILFIKILFQILGILQCMQVHKSHFYMEASDIMPIYEYMSFSFFIIVILLTYDKYFTRTIMRQQLHKLIC